MTFLKKFNQKKIYDLFKLTMTDYIAISVFYICAAIIIYKFIDSYFKFKTNIIIIAAVNRNIDIIVEKFTIKRETQPRIIINNLEDELMYKVFMETLMTVGLSAEHAKNIIINWIQAGRMSEDNDEIGAITEYFGSHMIKKLRDKVASYYFDDVSESSSDNSHVE